MQLQTKTMDMQELPGPTGIPLLGNLLQISPEGLHRNIERWANRYGSIYKIRLGTHDIVIVTATETVQYVLKNRPDKFRRLGRMDDVIREMGFIGVFNAEGDEWKRQRKFVSQALNLTRLKAFFPTLVSITEKLFNRWSRLYSESSAMAIKAELMRYTVDITSRLAFGYNMNTIEKDSDVIQDHLEAIFPNIYKRINSPVPYWRYFKLSADRKLEASLQVIHKTLQGIISKTREQLDENPALKENPDNFLQSLLVASAREEPISNHVIIGNVLTMLLAGEDTTAHTLAWVFYFMHLHPEVQKKMQREADAVLGNERMLVDYEDTTRLPYIEAVALEAMRLKPVAPMLFFETLENVEIDGYKVPKDTGVFVNTQYSANRKENFSEPEQFIPARWIAGACPYLDAHNERAFMPFGAGPRYCPGSNLAMLEMKAVLAMVCKNFEVVMNTNPAEVREIMAFTMMPTDFNIRFVKRTGE